jgi:hypothetical protein
VQNLINLAMAAPNLGGDLPYTLASLVQLADGPVTVNLDLLDFSAASSADLFDFTIPRAADSRDFSAVIHWTV